MKPSEVKDFLTQRMLQIFGKPQQNAMQQIWDCETRVASMRGDRDHLSEKQIVEVQKTLFLIYLTNTLIAEINDNKIQSALFYALNNIRFKPEESLEKFQERVKKIVSNERPRVKDKVEKAFTNAQSQFNQTSVPTQSAITFYAIDVDQTLIEEHSHNIAVAILSAINDGVVPDNIPENILGDDPPSRKAFSKIYTAEFIAAFTERCDQAFEKYKKIDPTIDKTKFDDEYRKALAGRNTLFLSDFLKEIEPDRQALQNDIAKHLTPKGEWKIFFEQAEKDPNVKIALVSKTAFASMPATILESCIGLSPESAQRIDILTDPALTNKEGLIQREKFSIEAEGGWVVKTIFSDDNKDYLSAFENDTTFTGMKKSAIHADGQHVTKLFASLPNPTSQVSPPPKDKLTAVSKKPESKNEEAPSIRKLSQ